MYLIEGVNGLSFTSQGRTSSVEDATFAVTTAILVFNQPSFSVPGPVPERPIGANPGLKFCAVLYFTFLCSMLRVTFCLLITVSRSKGSTVRIL